MEAATANFDAAKLKLWVVHPAFCRSRTGSHLETLELQHHEHQTMTEI
jgi:hypothetical protein